MRFIVDQDGSYYFMEINCRIQVEHPVTEVIPATAPRPQNACDLPGRGAVVHLDFTPGPYSVPLFPLVPDALVKQACQGLHTELQLCAG